MRISLLYILLLSTGLPLLRAEKALGQTSASTMVNIEAHHVPLKDVLAKIGDQTHFMFVFPPALLDAYTDVSLEGGNKSVKAVLDEVTKNTSLRYRETGTNIVLYQEVNSAVDDVAVLQDDIVRGIVTGLDGEVIAGVNILIKGTVRGTSTDGEGKYSLAAGANDVLIFSFIGYKNIEVPVNSRQVVDVALEEDIESLGEVVIQAGYWEVTERTRTGNISKITTKEIDKTPAGNPLSSLQARVPGVYVQQTSGVPGGGFNIMIRGRNSIRPEANNPLYIVDGIPYTSNSVVSAGASEILSTANPLNNINPADIESIEILKDADATAIYGSRGSNGVVLITTKRGKSGAATVNVNFYSGFGQVSNTMDLLSSQQYLQMRREAYANDGIEIAGSPARDLLQWDTTRYTDWQRKLIGEKSSILNAQVSVAGGNERTRFVVGAGYFKEGTVFPGDYKNQKLSSHINLNHSSENNRFELAFTNSYVYSQSNFPGSDLTMLALTLPPVAPEVYDASGNLNWQNNTWKNPFAELRRDFRMETDNMITNLTAKYEIVKGLFIKTSVGYNTLTNQDFNSTPIRAANPTDKPKGSAFFGDSRTRSWNVEPQLGYKKAFGNGSLDMLAGATFQETTTDGSLLFASGYDSDALLENKDAAAAVDARSSADTQYRYQAVFGRVNYIQSDRYIANITFRRDGSSRFGPGKQFANFGAAGLAWIFSEESFIQNGLPWMSFGKLRASYGITGSDQIPDYGYLDSYSPTTYQYGGQNGLIPTSLVNPDFQWETNRKLEVAADFGFPTDRIRLGVSWYRNRSSNQLVGYNLSLVTGAPSIQYNLPATVQNTGVEITLLTSNVKTATFSWSTSFNMTIPRNKLVKYENIETSPNAATLVVGEPLTIRRTYEYLGVDPATGVYQYQDVNGDNVISTPDDNKTSVNVGQQYYGGMTNTFAWRGWSLDVLFQFVKQTGIGYMNFFPAPGLLSNFPAELMGRWQAAGDVTDMQRFTTGTYGSDASIAASRAYEAARNLGSNAIIDGSFIRLKNVSLSYQLSSGVSEAIHASSCRLYLQGQNLLTFSDFKGLDPENMSYSSLPPLRVFTAGFQITF